MVLTRFQAYVDELSTLHWRWPLLSLAFPTEMPYIAGILNVTPDSFSDGGRFLSTEDALAHALHMVESGASLIDVGGQSTRPGHEAISFDEEKERVLPILKALRESLPEGQALISLDTDKADLADLVFGLGLADILNDVSGGDVSIAKVAARHQVPLVMMHNPKTADRGSVESVMEDMSAMQRDYIDAGLPKTHIALDPGLGFGKDEEENLRLFRECRRLLELGGPLYIGASRKRFVGKATGNPDAAKRLGGSLAVAIWAASLGVDFLRVHDVKETKEALWMTAALKQGRFPTSPSPAS